MHILFVGAHPDDAESAAGGTLARLARAGHQVRMLSVTNGDAGHYAREYVKDRSRLAVRRRQEAKDAAAIIGAEAADLGVHDGEVEVSLELTYRVSAAIRSFGLPGKGPDLVITHRPVDYHRDHRYTSRLVQDCAYMLTVPLFCPDARHLDRDPVIVYHADDFTEEGAFRPDVLVDVGDVLETKARMLAAHASQFFEWLPYNGGRLDQVPADDRGRLEMLLANVTRRTAARAERARATGVRVGPVTTAAHAELFQVSEYGRQPTDAELAELFGITG